VETNNAQIQARNHTESLKLVLRGWS